MWTCAKENSRVRLQWIPCSASRTLWMQEHKLDIRDRTLLPPLPPHPSPGSLDALPSGAEFNKYTLFADPRLLIQLNEPACLHNGGLLVKWQPGNRRCGSDHKSMSCNSSSMTLSATKQNASDFSVVSVPVTPGWMVVENSSLCYPLNAVLEAQDML